VIEKGVTYTPGGYDAAGNVAGYVVQNHEAGVVNKFSNSQVRYEGYQVGVTSAVSSKSSPGSTTQQYDANGFLTGITDSTQHANDRTSSTTPVAVRCSSTRAARSSGS
jgi:YD repeat-containing protein